MGAVPDQAWREVVSYLSAGRCGPDDGRRQVPRTGATLGATIGCRYRLIQVAGHLLALLHGSAEGPLVGPVPCVAALALAAAACSSWRGGEH